MKQTNKSAGGTSFHGVTISTTVNKLIDKVGDPAYVDNSGTDKTNFDWVLETDEGHVITIYDWKQYRPIGEDETIQFHIGAQTALISLKAKNELRALGV